KKKGARIFFYIPPHRVQRWLGGGQHVKIQLSDAGEAIFGSSNISHASFAAWNDFSVLLAGEIILEFAESFRTLGFPLERNHLLTLKKLIQNSIPEYNFTYHVFDPNKHQGVLGPLFWRKKNTITEAMVQLFEEARESVFLTSFYFKPTKKLFRAMLRAARRGVKITIFHSHRAALDATDLAWIAAAVKFDLLLKAKIRIFENKKGEHSKLVLVDGMKAALGSYNFEDAAHDRLAEAMLVTREKKVVESIQQIFDLLKRNSQNILVKKLWRKRLRFRLRIRIRLWGVFKRWL
ncbi:MAG TPA: phosphatidylserine/phosphatidylglycerophosphate/cardiolipin synthase family protein, partial [Turneriella sp.]|nr:phosphatidylserine/phosphatidylglycerophosphate/cardiolipin synthase family protein [Turneriella sp.]